ncbi:Transposase [Cordylochernes scorpioides]|uniref:Small ribosomal subunit protein eS25 n=1 Tax=Cordylochernes scorpioides TaxID=51811 RepID=A0ABY6LJC7_9ARAC|nr:Transposase [Cordylochernes scorpioides]
MPPKQDKKKKDSKKDTKKSSTTSKTTKNNKKKWSKGKTHEKLNNAGQMDKSIQKRFLEEVPKFKLITPAVVSERLKINVSLARSGLEDIVSRVAKVCTDAKRGQCYTVDGSEGQCSAAKDCLQWRRAGFCDRGSGLGLCCPVGKIGVKYYTRTISRRLVANGLHSCRPLRRLPLTPPNRRQRLEWCRARSTWMTEWHRVVFLDESRFCLSSDSRRVRVWRRRGERSNPAAIVERPTVRQRGIMVWGAIAYDSRSPLLRIQGTMTAQRYVDNVLRPVTLPYLQGVPNALYQQDNARPHTARISQQALQDVQMLPWPPYSPDLSPIEHVWDIIGRRLHALPQPRSEDELWQMVEREWRAIPQDAIRTLIDSLPRRVAACIAVRGGPTCY